jgi:hypothetical protein
VKGQNIMIGLAPREGFQKNRLNSMSCGWFIHVLSGRLFSQDHANFQAYGKGRIPVGSIVTAIHDTHQHTIEFQVNGTSLGIAFRNIPHVNLYAAVDIWGRLLPLQAPDFWGSWETEIRIVDDYY